jgi:hypothetical protein
MPYTWMITFNDITDESIRKLTDTYLTAHPDASLDYYDLTANKYINFVNSYGIDATTINQLDRSIPNKCPHYLVIQWLIICFQMLVSQNLIGLNNDSMVDDKWKYKYQMYRDDLKSLSAKITYETIVSGLMQQNYTRYANTFSIMV